MKESQEISDLKKLFESVSVKTFIPCAYCGMPATDKEHVIPRSYIESVRGMKQYGFNVKVPKEIIVPSCRECNLMASDGLFRNFISKKKYIREKFESKYAKALRTQLWKDEEVLGLSGNLQKQVFAYNLFLKITRKRHKNLLARAKLDNILSEFQEFQATDMKLQ